MNTERDRYWDDLGIAWVADHNPEAIGNRLDVRLRAQALWTTLLMATGIPLGAVMLALAVFTVYTGIESGAWNFVIRGVALLVLSSMMGVAVWFRRFDAEDHLSSLTARIDLAIARSRHLRRAARIGMAMCGVAAVLGLTGYFVRVRIGHAPAMSPLEPLALLALMSATLFVYIHYTAHDLDRLHYLKRTLSPESIKD